MDQRPTLAAILWPFGTGAVAMALSLAPIAGAAPGLQGPNWLLIALMFWAARRPWIAPPMLVFVLGFLFDLLRDGPIGAELLALLLMVEAVRGATMRRPTFGFLTEWMRFAIAAAGFELILVALLSITYSPQPDAWMLAQRFAATVLLYPLVAYGLQRLSGARPGEGRFAHLVS